MGTCSIDPLTWGNCIANAGQSAGQGIQTIAVGVFELLLSGILYVFQLVTQTLAIVIQVTIDAFAAAAIALGPWGAPIFVIFVLVLVVALLLAFELLKDIPIANDFT